MRPAHALRSLGSSGALTKTLATLDAAVLAALPRDAGDEPAPGNPLLNSELLPELSRMLTAAGSWAALAQHVVSAWPADSTIARYAEHMFPHVQHMHLPMV